jgi:hypothetical protein
MHPDRENELLLHVAAGTDPLTALAGLPRQGEQFKSSVQTSTHDGIAAAVIVAIAVLMLLR